MKFSHRNSDSKWQDDGNHEENTPAHFNVAHEAWGDPVGAVPVGIASQEAEHEAGTVSVGIVPQEAAPEAVGDPLSVAPVGTAPQEAAPEVGGEHVCAVPVGIAPQEVVPEEGGEPVGAVPVGRTRVYLFLKAFHGAPPFTVCATHPSVVGFDLL